MLEIGTAAPNFTLPDQDGVEHALADYRGQKVVLYFYPKDNTAGCTSQACSFRDLMPQFRERGAVVLGVSGDSVASHKGFEQKHGLPFRLLSDEGLVVSEAYGVVKETVTKAGRTSRKLVRSTYLIDEEGIIAKAHSSVKAKQNAADMLAEV